MISTEAAYTKKKARVLDYSMRYVDEGSGDPIVLIHGNPTSAYLRTHRTKSVSRSQNLSAGFSVSPEWIWHGRPGLRFLPAA